MEAALETDQQTERSVHRSFVQSIYSEDKALLVGVPTTTLAVGLTAHMSQAITLYALTIAMFVVGCSRYLLTRAFQSAESKADPGQFDYQKWENRYTNIAILHTFILGIWFPISVLTGNAFSQFISIALIMGNLIGVCGRNFPLARLVNSQIMAVGVPLIGGFIYMGGAYI